MLRRGRSSICNAAIGNGKDDNRYVMYHGRARPCEYETAEGGNITTMEGLLIIRYTTLSRVQERMKVQYEVQQSQMKEKRVLSYSAVNKSFL